MTARDTGSSSKLGEASEIETPPGENALAELGLALENAFADIRCLRCGHESFYLAGPAEYVYQGRNEFSTTSGLHRYGGPAIATVDLICKRCGMVESHALNILREFSKKVLPEGPNEG